jgi:TP901 family phage tail tape measure protein
MAKGFNLTAELNLRGPANIKKVVADIRRQLGTVQANVNVNFSANAIKNSAALNKTLKDLNGTLRNTVSVATKSSQAINNLSKTFATFGSVTSSASSVNNLSKSVSQLSSASASVAPQIKVAGTEMQEFGKQSALAIRRFAAFTTVSSAIFGLTRSITQGVQAFIDFDKELTKVQAVTGETKIGLTDLVNTITTLSTGLGVSSKDLTAVSLTLAQAGFSASDTAKALKALALTDLAPTFDNLSQTVEGSIALLRQFNINAGDLEKALGSINEVSAKFAVESSDIIAAIQRAGGVFATASKGVSEGTDALNEFVAVFTSVRATTRESAETIATGLRTIFTRIQRGKTIEALKDFGVTLTDAEGKFVGAFKAVQLLSEGLNKIDPRDIKFSQIVEELGGFRQIGKVIPLIQQFAVAQEALKVAQAGQDSLAADAVIAQTSLANQIVKTREQFLALFRDIGTTDTFQNITRGALGLASALITVADSIKGILPILAIIGTIKGVSALTQFTSGFVGGLKKAPGNAGGGKILGFNRGGVVPGSGRGDKIPALLEPGEVVMSNRAAEKYGRGNLVRMNKNNISSSRYLKGGIVDSDLNRIASRQFSFTDKINPTDRARTNIIPVPVSLTQQDFDRMDLIIKDQILNNKKLFEQYGTGFNRLQSIQTLRDRRASHQDPTTPEDFLKLKTGQWLPGYAFQKLLEEKFPNRAKGVIPKNFGTSKQSFKDIIEEHFAPLDFESGDAKFSYDGAIRYDRTDEQLNVLRKRFANEYSKNNLSPKPTPAIDKFNLPNTEIWFPEPKIKERYEKYSSLSSVSKRISASRRLGESPVGFFAAGGRALGARSKFKDLSETELAQLSTKDLIAYAKAQARDIFTTGGSGIAVGSEFIEVPQERIIPELESELTTYLGKRGFWREKVAPFGSSLKTRDSIARKMDSRTLRKMVATAGGVDSSALENVPMDTLLKYAEQAPRAPQEALDKTIAKYANISSIKPKFQAWGKNPSGGVFRDVVAGFEDEIRSQLDEPNKSRFEALVRAGSLDAYKAAGGKDGHIPPLKKAIYEITGVTEKRIGGLIQRLNAGGSVRGFEDGSVGGVATALDPTLEKLIQQIQEIGGTTDLYKFVSKPEIDDIIRSKGLSQQPQAKDIVSSKWLRKQTPDRFGDRSQYASALEEIVNRAKERFSTEQSGIQAQILRNLQAAEGEAYQFGLASIFGPNGELGYSSVSNAQEIEGKDGKKFLTQIVRKSLPSRYESAIKATSEDIAGLPQRAAERFQYADIFGAIGQLAFDFDETLVKGADIYNEKGKIDILAYNDLNRVQQSLKNAKLTLLGQELKNRLTQYPELMDNIRVLTARPQNNSPLLSAKLNELGLPIDVNKITGVSGGLNKVKNLSDLETLIDDNIENVESVLAGGKRAILYKEAQPMDRTNPSSSRALSVMEGYALEELVRNFGVNITSDEDDDPLKPIDFPKGLGANASKWGLPPNIPTDTKRTNSSSAASTMFKRAQKFYLDNFAKGGFVNFAGGGTVPAMVSNGEAFVPPDLAKRIGYSKLDKMNQADRNGMKGFAAGGISTFKGAGSGTSDSIGPIGLPEGSYVIRAKATKALGLNRGGAIKSFFFGGRSNKKDVVDETFEAVESFNPVSSQANKALEQAVENLLAKIVQNISDVDPSISFDDALARAQKDSAAGVPGSANLALKQAAESGDQAAAKAVANAQRQQVNAIIKEIRSIDKSVSITDAKAAAEKRVADSWGGLWKATNNATKATNQAAQAAGATSTTMAGTPRQSDKNFESAAARFGQKLGDNTTLIFSSLLPTIVSLYTNNIDVAASKSSATFAAALEGAITGFSSSIALGGQITSTAAGFASDESTKNLINAFGGIASVVIGAGAAVAQFIISSKNAAIEFDKADAKKKLDSTLDSVSKSFDELSKDIKNIDLQDAIIRKLQEAGDEAQRILTIQSIAVRGSFATLLSGDLLGSGGPETAQRSVILERSGTFAYIESFNDEIRKVKFASLIPQLANENAKLFSEVASNTNRILEEKLRSGASFDELTRNAAGEYSETFKSLARNIANADAEIQARILRVQSNESLSEEQKRATIESIQTIYAANEIRKRAAIIEAEQRVKEAEKSANLFSRSLERMFQNIEQSIGRTTFELERMKNGLDLVTASLTGQAKVGNSVITALNVLANPRAYNENERSQARTQASSLFVGNRNILEGLLTVSDNIEGTVLSTINKELREAGSEANNESIAAGIERAVRRDLADLKLPPDVSSKIANQVREGLVTLRKNQDDQIDFTDLVEKVPSLSKVIDSAKRAQEAAIKALEFWQNSLTNYSSAINQLVDLQVETNNRLRQSNKLLINSQIELAKTLGKDVSVETLTRARNIDIAARTGGATDPTAIFNRILQLENRRRGLQSAVDATANIGPSAVAANNFIRLNQSLKNNNVALREAYDALKELADSGDIASAALSKVQEAQQKTAARAGFLEKLVTSTPEELNNLNNSFFRLQRNLAGQTNTIQNSIGAQKAYFEALNNGSSAFEAIQAAQQAFVNERKETLDVFNQILPFLGQGQQANEMRANVLQSMLAESGFAMTPMFQDMINAIRNPEADPETKAAIDEYRKAVTLQSEANRLLGQLNIKLADDIANKSATALTDSLSKLKFTFETTELSDIRDNVIEIKKLLSGDKPVAAVPRASGGIIYASAGRAIDFSPKGTDTVPAMLTPGEFVVNRKATSNNLGLLQSINSGNYASGGKVKYYSGGGYVSNISKNLDDSIQTVQLLPDVKGLSVSYVVSPKNIVQSYQKSPISYTDSTVPTLSKFSNINSIIGAGPTITRNAEKRFEYGNYSEGFEFSDEALVTATPENKESISLKSFSKSKFDEYIRDFNQYTKGRNRNSWYPNKLGDVASLEKATIDRGAYFNPNSYNSSGFGLLLAADKQQIEDDKTTAVKYSDDGRVGRLWGLIGFANSSGGRLPYAYGTGPASASGQKPPSSRPDIGNYFSPASPESPIYPAELIPSDDKYKNIQGSTTQWINSKSELESFKNSQANTLQYLIDAQSIIDKYKIGDNSIFSSDIPNYNQFQNKLKNLLNGIPYETFDNNDEPFLDYSTLTNKNVRSLYILNNKYRSAVDSIANDSDNFDSSFKTGKNFAIKDSVGAGENFPWFINKDPIDVIKGFSIAKDKEDFDKRVQTGESLGFKLQTKLLSDQLEVGDYKLPYNITYGEYDGRFFDKTNNKLKDDRIKKFLVGYDDTDSFLFNKKNLSSAVGSYSFDSLDKIKETVNSLKNDKNIKEYLKNLSGTPTDISDVRLTPQSFLNKFNDAKNILGITDNAIDVFSSESGGSSVDITSWIIEAAKAAMLSRGEEAKQAVSQRDAFGDDTALNQDSLRSLFSNLLNGSVKLFQSKPGLPGLGKKWLGQFNSVRNILKNSRKSIELETLKQYSSQASNIFGFVSGQAQNILAGLTNTQSGSQNRIANFVQELGILTSGANSAFNILSSGRTGFLDSFINSDNIDKLENMFRTLGFNRVWSGIQGQQLQEGYKDSLSQQLQGSKIRTIDKSGKITTKDFAETDLSDKQSLVDLAFNPYNEFTDRFVRSNLIDQIIDDVKTATDSNGRKLFNNDTSEFIEENATDLRARLWLGDAVLDPSTTATDRQKRLDSIRDTNRLYDYNYSILGFKNKFGPLPDAEYYEKRLLVDPQTLSSGGTVYASNGSYINFQPKGTDTVPAMLTPGEFVVNRAATQKNLPLLQSINSGSVNYNGSGMTYAADGGTIMYRGGKQLTEEEMAKIRGQELAEKLKWNISEDNVDSWINQEPPEVIRLSQADRDALYDYQWSVSDNIANAIRNKKAEQKQQEINNIGVAESERGFFDRVNISDSLEEAKGRIESIREELSQEVRIGNSVLPTADGARAVSTRFFDDYLKNLEQQRKRRESEDEEARKMGFTDAAQRAGAESRIRFENAKKIQDQKIYEERKARELENGPRFVAEALRIFNESPAFAQYRNVPNFTDNIINEINSRYQSGKKAPLASDILSIARGASLSEGVNRVQAQSARIQQAQEKPFEAFAEELNKAAARRAERGSFIDSDNPLWKTLGYVGGVSEGIGNVAYGAANVVAGGAVSIGGRAYQAGAYLAGSASQQAAGAAFAQVGEEALTQGAYTAVELGQALVGAGPIQRGERSAIAIGNDQRVEQAGSLGGATRFFQNTGYLASQAAQGLAGGGYNPAILGKTNASKSLLLQGAELFGGKLPIKINNPLDEIFKFDDLKFANRGTRDFTKLSRGFDDIESISGVDKLIPQVKKANIPDLYTDAEAAKYLEILDQLASRKAQSLVAEVAQATSSGKPLTSALQTAEATIKKRGPLGDYESSIFKQVKDAEEAVKKPRINLGLKAKESFVVEGIDNSGKTVQQIIEASNVDEALKLAKKQEVFTTQVKPVSKTSKIRKETSPKPQTKARLTPRTKAVNLEDPTDVFAAQSEFAEYLGEITGLERKSIEMLKKDFTPSKIVTGKEAAVKIAESEVKAGREAGRSSAIVKLKGKEAGTLYSRSSLMNPELFAHEVAGHILQVKNPGKLVSSNAELIEASKKFIDSGEYAKMVGGRKGFYPAKGKISVDNIPEELFPELLRAASLDKDFVKNNTQAANLLKKYFNNAGYYKFGGVVYANKGALIPYQSRGTDTVPAMLTPGEFVVNKQATKDNLGLLQNINSGGVVYASGGGRLTREERLENQKQRREELREQYLGGKQTRRYLSTLQPQERQNYLANQQQAAPAQQNIAPQGAPQQQGAAPQQPLPDLQAQILASLVRLEGVGTTIANALAANQPNAGGAPQGATATNTNNLNTAITVSPEATEFLTQLTTSINNFGTYIDKLSGIFPGSIDMNINFGELVVRIEGAAGLDSLGERVKQDVLSIVDNKIRNMETLLNNVTGGEVSPPR